MAAEHNRPGQILPAYPLNFRFVLLKPNSWMFSSNLLQNYLSLSLSGQPGRRNLMVTSFALSVCNHRKSSLQTQEFLQGEIQHLSPNPEILSSLMLLGGSANIAWQLMLAHSTIQFCWKEEAHVPKGTVLFTVWEHGWQSGKNWAAGTWAASGPLDSASLSRLYLLRGLPYLQNRWPGIPVSPWLTGTEAGLTGLLQKMGGVSTDHQDPELGVSWGSQCRQDNVFFCRQPNGADAYFLLINTAYLSRKVMFSNLSKN